MEHPLWWDGPLSLSASPNHYLSPCKIEDSLVERARMLSKHLSKCYSIIRERKAKDDAPLDKSCLPGR